ncbi:MAG: ribonuclease HI [bacterium]|nr:ribonuclease HI [bacterium]
MAKTKKKYYAIARGRVPGIYTQWFGEGGAEAQVRGTTNALFKGFPTKEEAEAWMEAAKNGKVPDYGKKKSPSPTTAAKKTETKLIESDVVVYTDGGCINNPGPGGYGAVLLTGDKRKEISGGFRKTTNNRMELLACIEALKHIEDSLSIVLYSDSKYVVNGIEKGWAKRWRKKGWMRNADSPAENYDLWDQLLALSESHNVTFSWVKGHAGNPENERCDQLANGVASSGADLPEDVPYETGKTTVR